jgi:predicted nucleotide-binding protein
MPVNVFIGSSSEGECYAKVIQDVITNLGDYEVLPWRSAFIVGEATIESLITAAGNVDAAVFVATPDDIRVMRTRADLVIRDNASNTECSAVNLGGSEPPLRSLEMRFAPPI